MHKNKEMSDSKFDRMLATLFGICHMKEMVSSKLNRLRDLDFILLLCMEKGNLTVTRVVSIKDVALFHHYHYQRDKSFYSQEGDKTVPETGTL